jgi:hypothetical protein
LGQPGHNQIAAGLAAADAMVDRIAGYSRRQVRAMPDLRQRTLAPGTAPRSHRSRLPAHLRRPTHDPRMQHEPDRVSRGPRFQDAVLGRGASPLSWSRPKKYPDQLLERLALAAVGGVAAAVASHRRRVEQIAYLTPHSALATEWLQSPGRGKLPWRRRRWPRFRPLFGIASNLEAPFEAPYPPHVRRGASCRERKSAAVRRFCRALFRTRTGDPLLTMELLKQPVAAGGNGSGLDQAIFRVSESRTFAIRCAPSVP